MMASPDFDPDAYLAKPPDQAKDGFDPDAYLAKPPDQAKDGFDPDAYLAKLPDQAKDGFDPDAYLASVTSKTPEPKFQMEPRLEDIQSGKQNTPQGIDPKDLGMNDAGQYMNMKTGEVIPEQRETRRPSVLPITRNPAGELEPAMPKALELAGSLVTPIRGLPGALKAPPVDPFGITLSGGERAGDLTMRNAEQAAIRGGNPHAQEWVAQRQSQMQEANKGILSGLDPYGQVLAETPQEAGALVSQGTQSARNITKSSVDASYQAARDFGGEIHASAFENLGQGIKKSIYPEVVVNKQTTPIANQMVDFLDNTLQNLPKLNKADPSGAVNPEHIVGVSLEGTEELRKILSKWRGDAYKPVGDADTRATKAVLNAFDKHIDSAMNGGMYTGDKAAVDAWNEARAAHSNYRNTFTGNKNDPVGKKVQEIVGYGNNDPLTPGKVMDLVSGSISKPTALNIGVAKRLKSILGEDSPEWIAAKQGIVSPIIQAGEGEAALSTGQVAQRLSKFLNNDMSNVILSSQEKTTLRSYADLMRNITMPPGSYFPSAPGINKVVSVVANRVGAVIGAMIGRTLIPSMPLVGELGGLTVGSQVEKGLERMHNGVAKQLPLVAQQVKQWQKAVAASQRGYSPSSSIALSAANANLASSLKPLGIDFSSIIQSPTLVPAQQQNQQQVPRPPSQQKDGGRINYKPVFARGGHVNSAINIARKYARSQ
jgi:hypothetical protein